MVSKKICRPSLFPFSQSSCEKKKVANKTAQSLTIHKLNCSLQEPKTIEKLTAPKKVSVRIPSKILKEISDRALKRRGFNHFKDFVGIISGFSKASDDGINIDDMKSTPGPIKKIKKMYDRYYKKSYGNLYLIFPDLDNKKTIVSSFSNSIKARESCSAVNIVTPQNKKKNFKNALGLNLLFKLDQKTLKKGVKINFRLHGLKRGKIPKFVFLSTHKNFSVKNDEKPLLWKCRVIQRGGRITIEPVKKIKSLSIMKADSE